MPEYIPHIIHFTHCEQFMTPERAKNIVLWAYHNQRYKVHVWTSPTLYNDVVRALKTQMAFAVDKERAEKRRVKMGESGCSGIFKLYNGGVAVAGYSVSNHLRTCVNVYTYEALQSHNNEKELLLNVSTHMTTEDTEDVFGLWCLEIEGGIYINNVIKPSSGAIIPYISSSKGLLFPRHAMDCTYITTAAIAASKESKKPLEMMQYIRDNYLFPEQQKDECALDKVTAGVRMEDALYSPPGAVGGGQPPTLSSRLSRSMPNLAEWMPFVATPKKEAKRLEKVTVPNLIQDWFASEEYLDYGQVANSEYDFFAHTGYIFVVPENATRFIPHIRTGFAADKDRNAAIFE